MTDKIKVWITRHALGSGICMFYAEQLTDEMIRVDGLTYYHRPDWHETESAAYQHAEKMRQKRLASLKTQLARMEALSFERTADETR